MRRPSTRCKRKAKLRLDLAALRHLRVASREREFGRVAVGDAQIAASMAILITSRSTNHVSWGSTSRPLRPTCEDVCTHAHEIGHTHKHTHTQCQGRAHASTNAQSHTRTCINERHSREMGAALGAKGFFGTTIISNLLFGSKKSFLTFI